MQPWKAVCQHHPFRNVCMLCSIYLCQNEGGTLLADSSGFYSEVPLAASALCAAFAIRYCQSKSWQILLFYLCCVCGLVSKRTTWPRHSHGSLFPGPSFQDCRPCSVVQFSSTLQTAMPSGTAVVGSVLGTFSTGHIFQLLHLSTERGLVQVLTWLSFLAVSCLYCSYFAVTVSRVKAC